MAQLVSLVIQEASRVDDVVRAWVAEGITGLTLLDSTGLAHFVHRRELRDDLPLFPSLRKVFQSPERPSRLLFSIVSDDFDIGSLVKVTEQALGSLSEPNTGILFVVPVSHVVGLQPGPATGQRAASQH